MPSLLLYDPVFRFADTLEWDALRNNPRFQKTLAGDCRTVGDGVPSRRRIEKMKRKTA
jgi:hypothetical protein